MELETIKRVISDNAEKARLLQSENNYLVKAFFEKVFEDNGQQPIRYEGANKGEDNLIVEEGDIIEINEICIEKTTRNGEEQNVVIVNGICEESNYGGETYPYSNELLNLEDKNIVGVFEMFKNQF